MAANTKREPAAASVVPEGACAVDIRVFMLTSTLAMCVAFFAGVSIHLPLDHLMMSQKPLLAMENMEQPDTRFLELSHEDLKIANSHDPAGQHLLVDMIGVEKAFLDSEERLSDAMVRTVHESGLTMLSYHCHKLDPAGVSCVGVLLESHISFHTWPEEGVITLDLFTCGSNPLLPVVSVIERLFGIGDNVKTKWSHELRGYRYGDDKSNRYLENFSDLILYILSPLETADKKHVFSNNTKYQRVDIWDLKEEVDIPSFVQGRKLNLPDGDERWMSNDFAAHDRILFLDGTIQSTHTAEVTYHEALVHPVMFAHDGPTNVAVLGGGEGATIREVLKHATVESVTMIDIDGEFIDIARKYLPKMNDCSDLVGRSANCFDDEAVTLVLENGIKYFLDLQGTEQVNKPKPFDVLIVDALDPEENLEFVQDFYVDDAFLSAMLASMSEKGVLVIQIGTAPELSDPKADIGMYQVRERLFNLFEAHSEVATMFVYEEPKSGFLEPHSFLVVCKDSTCRNRWYSRSDAIDYEIYKRIIPTKSGEPALKFYDGTIQHIYQATPKAWETVYCRREPTPFECSYVSLDFTRELHELNLWGESSFRLDLRKNGSGDVVDVFVFAKTDIPKGSFIMPGDLSRALLLGEGSIDAINRHIHDSTVYKEFASFIASWAHHPCMEGTDTRFLEVGASTLIRKADGGGVNVGRWVPPHPTGKRPTFSPVYDRHRISFEVFLVALEDIPAGFELFRSKDEWSC